MWSRTVRSVACTGCEQWFHKECLQMPLLIYEELDFTDVSWYCCTSGLPNCNSSLFEEYDANLPRVLHQHVHHSPLTMTVLKIGSPRYTSSPTSRRRCPTLKRKLRVIVANLQSIRAKRETFWAMSEYSASDVTLATETWLNPAIAEREVLPDNYSFVARRDRPNSTYGGVAIIARQKMEVAEVKVNYTSEFVAAVFNATSLKKSVFISCLYRPTDNSIEYCQELCHAMNDFHS